MLQKLDKHMKLLRKWFVQSNTMALRKASNEWIESAAANSDKLLAEVSVVAYCLHKLLSKPHVLEKKRWNKVKGNIVGSIDNSILLLKRNDFSGFKEEIESLSEKVVDADEELGNFVQNLFEKAKVKQASRAYALGMSLSRAAELTKASKKSLLRYIGGTKIHEQKIEGKGIRERMNEIRAAFK